MKHFKKIDLIIIAVVCIIGLALWFFLKPSYEGEVKAEIYYKSKLIKTANLSHDETFSLEENENVVFHIKDGKIAFKSSDCPDKICINTGYINKVGESAVCLPNEIILKIVPYGGHKENDYDIIVGK